MVKMRLLVIWLLQSWKAFPVFFCRLSLNIRWIISFSRIKCLLYNKMLHQIPPSISHPAPLSLKLPLLKVIAVLMQNMNGRSLDCYDSSKSSNKWNTLDLYILILTALYSCSLWNVIKLIFKFELFPLTFPTLLPNRAATVLMQFQVATIFLWQHFGVFINFRRPSPLVCDLNSSSLILPSANSTLTKLELSRKTFRFGEGCCV